MIICPITEALTPKLLWCNIWPLNSHFRPLPCSDMSVCLSVTVPHLLSLFLCGAEEVCASARTVSDLPNLSGLAGLQVGSNPCSGLSMWMCSNAATVRCFRWKLIACHTLGSKQKHSDNRARARNKEALGPSRTPHMHSGVLTLTVSLCSIPFSTAALIKQFVRRSGNG